jgi:uncharacterized repeat protein (TIGR01451 family)
MKHKNLLTGLALAIFSIFFAGLSAMAAPNDPDIVGGEEAVPGAWPWQAALVHSDAVNMYDGQFCGAVLVDEWWVLTAAHCVTGRKHTDIDIVLGAHNLFKPEPNVQRISSLNFIVHPDYSAATNDSDIALIQLATPATLTAGANGGLPVQSISLVVPDVGTLEGEFSTVTGWGNRSAQPTPGGFDYPETLHQVELPILSNEACNEAFEANYISGDVTENMMCAGFQYKGGRDSCFGDSGGPLMVQDSTTSNWNLAGLVSWGYGCAMPGLPGVYTRVSQFTPWVTETMERPIVILEKGAAAQAITPGDGLRYTLSLQNVGTVLVSNLVISDTIPAGTSLVPNSISNGGFLDNSVILWNVPPLQPNGTFSGEFAVEVSADYLTSLVHFSDNLEGDLAAWAVDHDPAYADSDWFVTDYWTHSGSTSWFAPNLGQVGDQYLILNVPGFLPSRMELSFWHYYDLETWYDGGVIEISTDNGATWDDLGHLILENGYTLQLDGNTLNPLAGRLAFSDYTFDWIQTRVDLQSYAGQAVQIRFRLGTDEVYGYYGWNIDDIVIGRSSKVSNQAFVNGVPSNVTETAVVPWLPTDFSYFPVLVPPSAENQPPIGYP